MDTIARTLWTDDASKRFYLVPDGVALPEGPLRLRAGASRFLQVDPQAVAPYEVSREEARAFLDARAAAYVDGLKHSFLGQLDRFKATPAQPVAEPPGGPIPTGPATALFSTLTGVPEEEVVRGPEAMSRAVEDLLLGTAAPNPEDARRLYDLAGEVNRAAADAGARLNSLVESLEKLRKPPRGS